MSTKTKTIPDALARYARRGRDLWRLSRSRPGLPAFRLPAFPHLSAEAEEVRERINSLADAEDAEQAKIAALTAELETYRRTGRRSEVAQAHDAQTEIPEDRTAKLEAEIEESKRLIATYRRMQIERLDEIEGFLIAVPEAAVTLRGEVETRVKKEITTLRKILAVLGSEEMRSDLGMLKWSEDGGPSVPQPLPSEMEQAAAALLRIMEAWVAAEQRMTVT